MFHPFTSCKLNIHTCDCWILHNEGERKGNGNFLTCFVPQNSKAKAIKKIKSR